MYILTYIHTCMHTGRIECIMYLIGEAEADVSRKDSFGKSPSDYSPAITKMMQSKGKMKRITTFFRRLVFVKCFWVWQRCVCVHVCMYICEDEVYVCACVCLSKGKMKGLRRFSAIWGS